MNVPGPFLCPGGKDRFLRPLWHCGWAGTGVYCAAKASLMRIPSLFAAALAVLAMILPAWAGIVAEVPYHVGSDGRVATDVFVNGQGPFRFLLDTAASRSMMFEHLRAKLGLGTTGDHPLTVYGMQNIGIAVPVMVEELRL